MRQHIVLRLFGSAIAGVAMAMGIWGCAVASRPHPAVTAVTAETAMLWVSEAANESQVNRLERRVASHPSDMEARYRLIGYYARRAMSDPTAQAAQRKHVLYLIAHDPDGWFDHPALSLDRVLDPEGYAAARKLWLRQVDRHGRNTRVLANAADFFGLSDRALAEKLLLRAQTLEPKQTEWSQRLAFFYKLHVREFTGNERQATAAKGLVEIEKVLSAATTDRQRLRYLADAGELALEAGHVDAADRYAHQLLDLATEWPEEWGDRDWRYIDALHQAHQTLGRVALRRGDVDAATTHLMESIDLPADLGVRAFEPKTTLAQELLEAGQTQAVINYLEKCRQSKAWIVDGEQFEVWIILIKAGKMPALSGI